MPRSSSGQTALPRWHILNASTISSRTLSISERIVPALQVAGSSRLGALGSIWQVAGAHYRPVIHDQMRADAAYGDCAAEELGLVNADTLSARSASVDSMSLGPEDALSLFGSTMITDLTPGFQIKPGSERNPTMLQRPIYEMDESHRMKRIRRKLQTLRNRRVKESIARTIVGKCQSPVTPISKQLSDN